MSRRRQPRQCVRCGCTDDRACLLAEGPQVCAWVDEARVYAEVQDVCTACLTPQERAVWGAGRTLYVAFAAADKALMAMVHATNQGLAGRARGKVTGKKLDKI
ncbi:MAG: hypothetical protein AB1705_15420 [Verrucomicrobiota bacterium]